VSSPIPIALIERAEPAILKPSPARAVPRLLLNLEKNPFEVIGLAV